MPRLALLVVSVWFVALFVFRTLLQWWRTGSGGIRGFSGNIGSLGWNAGLLTSLGLAAAVLAPPATLLGWPGGGLWFERGAVHGVGAVLAALGIAGAFAAQLAMGASWRIGVDARETTALVTRGPFRWVRNPIFSFMLLFGAGLFALLPSAFSLLSFALMLVGVEIHVRAVEEPYLARTHGRAYLAYAARVGRFVPGVGLLAADASEAA